MPRALDLPHFIASHWPFFAHQVAHSGQPDVVLNRFTSRDGIESRVADPGQSVCVLAKA